MARFRTTHKCSATTSAGSDMLWPIRVRPALRRRRARGRWPVDDPDVLVQLALRHTHTNVTLGGGAVKRCLGHIRRAALADRMQAVKLLGTSFCS